MGEWLFKGTKKNRPRGHFGDRADPPEERKSPREAGPSLTKKAGLDLVSAETKSRRGSDHVCRISPREAGLLGIKKAVRPEHKCRISPREAGAKLIKKDGPRLK